MNLIEKVLEDPDKYDVGIQPRDWPRRYVISAIELMAQIAWAIAMTISILGKLANDSLLSYVMHFTNWSWTLQTVFYTATLFVPLLLVGLIRLRSFVGYFSEAIVVLLFFPLNGIVWSVMVLVSALLGFGSPFITDFFERYPPGIVFLGNDLFHVFPVLALVIFAFLYGTFILMAHYDALMYFDVLRSPARLTSYVLYQAYIGPLILATLYALIFDPRIVYETTLPFLVGFVILIMSLTVFNLTAVLFVFALILRLDNEIQSETILLAWFLRNHGSADFMGGIFFYEKKTGIRFRSE